MAYCGVECQEEHWNKVHKKHCKYLAGIKKAKHSEHKRNICRTCTARISVGDLVFSPTNLSMSASLKMLTLTHWLVPKRTELRRC